MLNRLYLLALVMALPLLVEGEALAQAPPEEVQAAMQNYFDGETSGAYLLGGMGAFGLISGGLLYRRGTDFSRGASYPLLGFGLLHVIAGGYVYVSSKQRIDEFSEQIDKDPKQFAQTEHQRMQGVQTQLSTLKIIELILITGGAITAGVGASRNNKKLMGIGLAISLEASLTLGFDVIAARRADRYVSQLGGFKLSVQPSTQGGFMLSHAGLF